MSLKACLTFLLLLLLASATMADSPALLLISRRQHVLRLRPDSSLLRIETEELSEAEVPPPFLEEGRAFVALRSMVPAGLGSLHWNQSQRYAEISFRDSRKALNTVRIRPGLSSLHFLAPGGVEVEVELDLPVVMREQRLYLSARDLCRLLELDLHYQDRELIVFWHHIEADLQNAPSLLTSDEFSLSILCQQGLQNPDVVVWRGNTGIGAVLHAVEGGRHYRDGRVYNHYQAVVKLDPGLNRLEAFLDGRPADLSFSLRYDPPEEEDCLEAQSQS